MAKNSDSYRASVLIVDDESAIRDSLRMILEYEGYRVEEAGSGPAALARVADRLPDAVLLDVKMPEMDGIEVLRAMRERGYDVPVLVVSGHADVATAVEATRLGAYDFFEKPLQRDRVLVSLRNAVESARLRAENRSLGIEPETLIGAAAAMRKLRETIDKAAPTNATVLITGESGTGKELVARAIHRASGRRERPLVQVNCAAIPEELIESELFGHEKGSFTGAVRKQMGKFVTADSGTIFLDEIGDMSARTQAKVLRVLQNGEVEPVGAERTVQVDVRVIAATNRNLEDEIAGGRFREDLYYRLNVIPLHSPALGGIIIGHEVAAALGVPFRFAERKGEELGLRRGFSLRQGERVVIVEDVVTTGRSTLETAALATSRGARVVAIGAIIDRAGGTGGHPPFDVPFRTLITLDLPSYSPAECPQCQAGSSPEKPGSRPDAGESGGAGGARLDVH